MNGALAQALESAAVLGAIVRPLLVATLLVGLWFALTRAQLAVRQRLLTWGVVATILIAWLITVWTLSAHGIFAPTRSTPSGMIVVPMILLVAVMLTALMRSGTIAAAIDATPLWWLVAYQGYRVAGLIFVRLWADGLLPGFFALPAGIGDMLTGMLAIGSVIALWRKLPWARTFAYAVNIFGVADLVNAITMALLSIVTSDTASPLLMHPLPIVPIFGVPLAFIVHSVSLWQLHRRARASSDGNFLTREPVFSADPERA